MTLLPPRNLYNVRNIALVVGVIVAVVFLGHIFAPQLKLNVES